MIRVTLREGTFPTDLPTIPAILRMCGGDPTGTYGPSDLRAYHYPTILHIPPTTGVVSIRQILASTGRTAIARAEVGTWGRIWMNVRGWYPNGVVCPAHYQDAREEVMAIIHDNLPDSEALHTEDLWPCDMAAPNIMVRLPGWTFEDSLEDILIGCGVSIIT